jgi:hypothetical protein
MAEQIASNCQKQGKEHKKTRWITGVSLHNQFLKLFNPWGAQKNSMQQRNGAQNPFSKYVSRRISDVIK